YNAGEVEVARPVRDEVESVSARTLARWQKQLREEGPAALAGHYGARSGRDYQTVIDADPELQNFVVGMIYGHPHCSAKQVMRGLRTRFAKDRIPSYRTVQRYIEQWRAQNAQLDAYLKSPDAWRGKHKVSVGQADAGVTALNQLWELDSTLG